MALSWDEIKSIIVLIKIPPHPFGCYQFMQISLINGPTRYTMKFARLSRFPRLAPHQVALLNATRSQNLRRIAICAGGCIPVAKYESQINKYSVFNKNAISLKKNIPFVQIASTAKILSRTQLTLLATSVRTAYGRSQSRPTLKKTKFFVRHFPESMLK